MNQMYKKLKKLIKITQGFLAIIQGLCHCFDRYNEFLTFFKNTIKSNKENLRNYQTNKNRDILINEKLLEQEEKLINKKKLEFEKNLLEEIKIFDGNYERKYVYFINKFDEKIKLLTNLELKSMSNYTNYYK